jgi:hypothetical protein
MKPVFLNLFKNSVQRYSGRGRVGGERDLTLFRQISEALTHLGSPEFRERDCVLLVAKTGGGLRGLDVLF